MKIKIIFIKVQNHIKSDLFTEEFDDWSTNKIVNIYINLNVNDSFTLDKEEFYVAKKHVLKNNNQRNYMTIEYYLTKHMGESF